MNGLCNLLINKEELKEKVFTATTETMMLFKEAAGEFENYFRKQYSKEHTDIEVIYQNKNQHEFQLKFGGDILIFLMHTDVFEFSRNHEVMRTKYISEDKDRSYCGMIQVFNFLSDSFKYDRINDLGYMIGRILINKEKHYFVEGKRELAQILNNFSTNKMDAESAKEILHSAIKYTVNFDLLLPDYNTTKEISVQDIMRMEDSMITVATAKRLGFRFEKDNGE
ncbi:hypothetical protein LJC68_10160 [Bacteroidales bacterium OttesenSCG-928-B11]|nr:hypothetical protein [Bacteroidales bacterium OttesenSCG-928-C03]MDL2313224.1 hypothetical protein [Bacteroidales bacterium OttesenSCG-928-B11]